MTQKRNTNPLLDKNGALKEDAKEKILQHASNVECECPVHLLKVAEAINAFQVYETNCLIMDLKQSEELPLKLFASDKLSQVFMALY